MHELVVYIYIHIYSTDLFEQVSLNYKPLGVLVPAGSQDLVAQSLQDVDNLLSIMGPFA